MFEQIWEECGISIIKSSMKLQAWHLYSGLIYPLVVYRISNCKEGIDPKTLVEVLGDPMLHLRISIEFSILKPSTINIGIMKVYF